MRFFVLIAHDLVELRHINCSPVVWLPTLAWESTIKQTCVYLFAYTAYMCIYIAFECDDYRSLRICSAFYFSQLTLFYLALLKVPPCHLIWGSDANQRHLTLMIGGGSEKICTCDFAQRFGMFNIGCDCTAYLRNYFIQTLFSGHLSWRMCRWLLMIFILFVVNFGSVVTGFWFNIWGHVCVCSCVLPERYSSAKQLSGYE